MPPAIAIVLAALVLAAPPPTVPPAPPPAADEEPDPAVRAGQLFRDGQFERAAEAFAEAYARTGDPAFLFGRAQALRRAGSCAAAIEVFEAFIAASPPEADVQAANDVIAACQAILAQHGPAPDAPETDDPAPAEPPPDEPAPPPPRWSRDVAGGVLFGAGLAVTLAGGAVYGTAFARASARAQESERAYEARRGRVRTLAATGAGLMAAGSALLVGSVVRYVIVARRQRARGPLARSRGGDLR